MDDRAHRVAGDQLRDGGGIGDVARLDGHVRTGLGQFGDQLPGAVGRGAAAAHQQQVPHPALDHQVPGDDPPQPTRTAGQQHGAVDAVPARARRGAGGDPGQSRGKHLAVACGGLRLARGDGGQHGRGVGAASHLHQAEAARVLGDGGAHQAPKGRVGQVAAVDGVRGDEDQAGVGEPLLRQPLPHQLQATGGQGVDGVHHRVGPRRGVGTHPDQHRRRYLLGGGQGFQVGEGHEPAVRQSVGPEDSREGRGRVGIPEDADRTGAGRVTRCLGPDPVHPEEGVTGQGVDSGGVGGDPAEHQVLDAGDGRTGGVGHGDRHGLVAGPGHPDPDLPGAGGVQAHPFPGERDHPVRETAQGRDVEGGVEERRVEAVGGGVTLGGVGQGDLGEDVVAPAPGGPQALEERPVPVAALGHARVQAGEVEGFGVGGGPHRGVELHGALPGSEDTGGVLGPGLVVGALGAGAGGKDAAAGGVGGAHVQVELDAALLGQDQRGGEGQFLDAVAADLVAGADREFHEGRAGQQRVAHDDVLAEPGMGAQGQPGGEQQAAGVGEFDGGAEQGVAGGAQAGGLHVPGGCRCGHGPVVLVLEGVRGQVDEAGAGPGEDGGPVDGRTGGVEAAQRGERGDLLVTVLAQERNEDGVLTGAGPRHATEHPVGPQLHEPRDTLRRQSLDTVIETDGLTDMPHPVVRRGQFTGFRDPARDVRDDRQRRLRVRQAGQGLTEVSEHRLHQRRVESVRHPQPADPAPLLTERLRHRLDRVLGSRDDHRRRTVDRSDRHTLDGLQMRQHLRLGRLHSHHRAALRQRLHQPPTSSHQSTRVRQREHTRHMRGRHLTDRMTGNELRPNPPRLDQPEQRHLDGEKTRLRVRRPIQNRRVVAPDHLTQRPLQVRVQPGAHRVERLREHRETLVQPTPHPQTLRPLPREQERGGGAAEGVLQDGGVGFVGGEGGEGCFGGSGVGGEDDRAVRERGAAGGEGEGDVHGARGLGAGVVGEVGQEPCRLGA